MSWPHEHVYGRWIAAHRNYGDTKYTEVRTCIYCDHQELREVKDSQTAEQDAEKMEEHRGWFKLGLSIAVSIVLGVLCIGLLFWFSGYLIGRF